MFAAGSCSVSELLSPTRIGKLKQRAQKRLSIIRGTQQTSPLVFHHFHDAPNG